MGKKKDANHKRNVAPNTKRRRNDSLHIPLPFEQIVDAMLKTPPSKKRKNESGLSTSGPGAWVRQV
jgi:hypothetical protein